MVPSRSPSRSTRSPRKDAEDRGRGAAAARRVREEIEERLPSPGAVSSLVASALTAAGAKALKRWAGSRRPALARLVRGAAAGAGAAGVVFVARRLLVSDAREMELVDELLAGAGKGVVYAALLDPYLPGPPVVRGALVGTADYLMAPWGGLISRLQSFSPARRIPLVGALLETGDAEEDPYLAFVLYGIALAVLHGEGGDDDEA